MKLARGLLLGLALLFLAAPTLGGSPFIEYQDVPIYVDGTGWCIQRTTWTTMPSGDTVTSTQLIC